MTKGERKPANQGHSGHGTVQSNLDFLTGAYMYKNQRCADLWVEPKPCIGFIENKYYERMWPSAGVLAKPTYKKSIFRLGQFSKQAKFANFFHKLYDCLKKLEDNKHIAPT